MKAIVTKIEDGVITVKLRRSAWPSELYKRHYDLKVGESVNVKRRTNNPYLIRIA